MDSPAVYAQFTDDPQVPVRCERPSCPEPELPAGTTRFPIRNHSGNVRFLCKACYDRYMRNPNTRVLDTTRPAHQVPHEYGPPAPLSHADLAHIRVQTNSAQRKAPPGSALQPVGLMTPPFALPPPSQRNIYIPGAHSQSQLMPPAIPAVGYSQNHQFYSQNRAALAALAYRSPEEHITIQAKMMTQTPGKPNGKLLFNIQEGISRVPAHIGSVNLKCLIFDKLSPLFSKETSGYHIPIERLGLRITDTWEDLDNINARVDAIYHCFEKLGPKGTKVFKAPKTFPVALIVSHADWLATEKHMECVELVALAQNNEASKQQLNKSTKISHAEDTWPASQTSRFVLSPSPPPIEELLQQKSRALTPPLQITNKRERSQESTPHTPPSKRPFTNLSTEIVWTSPDRTALRNILASEKLRPVSRPSGELSQAVEFHPIIIRDFNDLIATHPRVDFSGNPLLGQLASNPRITLGKGSLKTAHPGTLSLHVPPSTDLPILGSTPHEKVAVKRAYTLEGTKIKRYPASQEVSMMSLESNALYWASSLMDMVYRFTNSKLAKMPAENSSGISIPKFRFVNAGMAIFRAPDGTHSKAVLLEEFIGGSEGEFRKFVHNGSATPLPPSDDPDYDLASFLCFAQHVQWSKTGGLAYVSDFQGGSTLLSDPQIMTHPALAAVFSQGNVAACFQEFPNQHVCNDFCKFFSLDHPEAYVSELELPPLQF